MKARIQRVGGGGEVLFVFLTKAEVSRITHRVPRMSTRVDVWVKADRIFVRIDPDGVIEARVRPRYWFLPVPLDALGMSPDRFTATSQIETVRDGVGLLSGALPAVKQFEEEEAAADEECDAEDEPRIGVRLPYEEWLRFRTFGVKNRVSQKGIIRAALRMYLDSQEGRAA